jgi:RimJ/RimL family protein N-acetyltransferase
MPKTVENRADWYESASKDKTNYRFCIRPLDDNRLIGYCSIIDLNYTSRNGTVAIYIGESSEWGQGFGTDAMNVLVRFAFMDVNLHRLSLYVFSYNQRAIRSYEKVGFVHEGVLPETLYRDGTYHHIHVMGILRHEWIAKHHPEVKIS